MAGADHESAIPGTNNEKLIAEQNQKDPSKFYNHLLYKAVIVVIFLVILPLVPSEAPEFINQTLVTKNWELLHLVFVGIAISYGLFSRRRDETQKETSSKFDNTHSVVSRFLQVSSFFDDEGETSSGSEENKVQMWSNQYYRKEPSIVVASQHSNFDKQRVKNSEIGEKPLLLPIRSLKSRVSDPNAVQAMNESRGSSVSPSGSSSKSGFKRYASNSNKARNGESENVVLPSPIPWRSRSGRSETRQEVDGPIPHAPLPSKEDSGFNKLESHTIESQTFRSSRANSKSSSPKLSPSPSLSSPMGPPTSASLSSEFQAKNAEDLVRKKGFYKSFSPPPPPPPPPPVFQKSISMKPRPSSFNEGPYLDKELKRSFTTSERKEMNRNSGREGKQMGKSVRTVRPGQNVGAGRRDREIGDEEKIQLEAEEDLMEEPIDKTVGHEHMSFRTAKLMGHGIVPLESEPVGLKFREKEKESFLDKVIVESDEDSDTEDDEVGESFIEKDFKENPPLDGESSIANETASSSVSDEGPDVDKKADEFIAKFREQIRLQRIESIKRSARITRISTRLS